MFTTWGSSCSQVGAETVHKLGQPTGGNCRYVLLENTNQGESRPVWALSRREETPIAWAGEHGRPGEIGTLRVRPCPSPASPDTLSAGRSVMAQRIYNPMRPFRPIYINHLERLFVRFCQFLWSPLGVLKGRLKHHPNKELRQTI
jgi:hypothetical protein